jgi:putative transposase
LIEKLSKQYSVVTLCKYSQVSCSGYYKWLQTKDKPDKDHIDFKCIQTIFLKKNQKAGWRTISMELDQQKNHMNHKKIQRIMRKYNLLCTIRRKKPYKKIMKKTKEHRVFPNIVQQEFNVISPYTICGTDITYIWFKGTFVYLSMVKDFCTGEILAHHLDRNLYMSLVIKTIEKISVYTPLKLTVHSDQGFHYTNPQYQNCLKNMNMVQSMSRKGNCLDNAPTESFFGHLKDELDSSSCSTFDELSACIDEYIHYYNHERKQWSKKKMTPIEYRDHLLKNKLF